MGNTVEAALSETADTFEELVNSDNALAADFRKLLQNGQTPFVYRLLDHSIPGYSLLIRVEPTVK